MDLFSLGLSLIKKGPVFYFTSTVAYSSAWQIVLHILYQGGHLFRCRRIRLQPIGQIPKPHGWGKENRWMSCPANVVHTQQHQHACTKWCKRIQGSTYSTQFKLWYRDVFFINTTVSLLDVFLLDKPVCENEDELMNRGTRMQKCINLSGCLPS